MDPVKAKIQELCPDVMDLKFGCRVEAENGARYTFLGHDPYKGNLQCFAPGIVDLVILYEHRVEILGSPITLAVVLRAIGTGVRLEESLSSNEIAIGVANVGWTRWNVLHDNYDQQSDETKAFIGSLLTNEK